VSRGEIRSCVRVDAQSRTREQTQCRFLQTALRNAKTKFHSRSLAGRVDASAPSGNSSVKQDRVPVWQTLPSPSTRTLKSTVSRSQSVHASTTRGKFPKVSSLAP